MKQTGQDTTKQITIRERKHIHKQTNKQTNKREDITHVHILYLFSSKTCSGNMIKDTFCKYLNY